jgi:hypothetical protein
VCLVSKSQFRAKIADCINRVGLQERVQFGCSFGRVGCSLKMFKVMDDVIMMLDVVQKKDVIMDHKDDVRCSGSAKMIP